jgi:hypothetical protein
MSQQNGNGKSRAYNVRVRGPALAILYVCIRVQLILSCALCIARVVDSLCGSVTHLTCGGCHSRQDHVRLSEIANDFGRDMLSRTARQDRQKAHTGRETPTSSKYREHSSIRKGVGVGGGRHDASRRASVDARRRPFYQPVRGWHSSGESAPVTVSSAGLGGCTQKLVL